MTDVWPPCDNCSGETDKVPAVDVQFNVVTMQFLCAPCRWATENGETAYLTMRRMMLRGRSPRG